jgi:dUTP pyrophosphatase
MERGVVELKLVIVDKSLIDVYKDKVDKHNMGYIDDEFADSGFDLFVPDTVVFDVVNKSKFIDMGVKAEMVIDEKTSPFYIYPRSSISKTPLMLANNTGVIDAGYRGNLIGAFRSFDTGYTVDKHTRLVQICSPNLSPMYVKIVDECELSTTIRGTGGFGSTGK